MNVKHISLNGKSVLVFDAPINATHGRFTIKSGARYDIYRKNKVQETHVIDSSNLDPELEVKYISNIVNIGMLKVADESLVADLFTPVKRGNFYDYEHNGIFYPTAISALRDIIDQDCKFENPFVLVIM